MDLKVVLVRAMLPIVDTDIELSAGIMRDIRCKLHALLPHIVALLSSVIHSPILFLFLVSYIGCRCHRPAAVHSNFVSDDQSSPELKLTRLQLERLWLPAHLSTYSTKKMSPGRPVKLEKPMELGGHVI